MLDQTHAPAASGEIWRDTEVEMWKRAFREQLYHVLGRFPETATLNDKYLALARSVRNFLLGRWVKTSETYYRRRVRTVCYLSAEFLLGPHLGNNLVNLGAFDTAREAMEEFGLDFQALLDQELEPGLGHGGLGRLAACYLDSLATLQIPATGYGIRYEFGMFEQQIRDGWQVEKADKWLRLGNPWEIRRPEIAFTVSFGGHTETFTDEHGRYRVRWVPARVVKGVAHDTPILGYRVNTANMLRLWSAEAVDACEFDLEAFNTGDYYGAVEKQVASEAISKVLYPDDSALNGKRLRLEQQYFLVACALQDMVRIHRQTAPDLTRFHEKYAVQLNDTHPALAVVELMRILVDDNAMAWDQAWDITRKTMAYTNHTLLPEALERWPLSLFGNILPRHLEIVHEINRRFLDEVARRYPDDPDRLRRLSLIDHTGEHCVNMAHLACVGSHAVNGVAALHSDLLKRGVLKDFYELAPEKFFNVTNGVTPRRFILLNNPGLTRLVTGAIGEAWTRDLEALHALEPMADDAAFRAEWRAVKQRNKEALAAEIQKKTGLAVDPATLLDVQVKRFHEYKRQHLNLLHVITLYHRLKAGEDTVPRTVVFAGKAAPGYVMAKRIIKLIHSVAEVINADPATAGRLRVVFIPGYNVKGSQRIFPAADLSEQISLAGKEASGTGNMKFAMNGALTIGTLDGANIEIRDAVGADNFFLFGMTVKDVQRRLAEGYRPHDFYQADHELKAVIDAIAQGAFSHGDREIFKPVVDNLMWSDPFMLLADYRAYVDCQDAVGRAWREPERWTRASILNAARMGGFSSDRSIRDYCRDIWRVDPVPIPD